MLYNFALSISYGDLPTVNIKDIRSWQILNYILYNLNDINKLVDIPECWKDIEETENTNEDFSKEDNKMSIKEKLLEAGRYGSVLNILEKITNDNQSTYPTDPYVVYYSTKTECRDDSRPIHTCADCSSKETKWRVDGEDVRKEASKLISRISLEQDETIKEEDYFNLRQYISTETCRMLHNYAVSISHRNDNPKEDMEVIRTWEILENLLFNLDDVSSWTIPNGWKADKEEEKEIIIKKGTSNNGDTIEVLYKNARYNVYCNDQLISSKLDTFIGKTQAISLFNILMEDQECLWTHDGASFKTNCGSMFNRCEIDNMERCPRCHGIIKITGKDFDKQKTEKMTPDERIAVYKKLLMDHFRSILHAEDKMEFIHNFYDIVDPFYRSYIIEFEKKANSEQIEQYLNYISINGFYIRNDDNLLLKLTEVYLREVVEK